MRAFCIWNESKCYFGKGRFAFHVEHCCAVTSPCWPGRKGCCKVGVFLLSDDIHCRRSMPVELLSVSEHLCGEIYVEHLRMYFSEKERNAFLCRLQKMKNVSKLQFVVVKLVVRSLQSLHSFWDILCIWFFSSTLI